MYVLLYVVFHLPRGDVDSLALSSLAAATTANYTLSLHDALPISRLYAKKCHACRCSSQIARPAARNCVRRGGRSDRKSTRLNSSHITISYAVFCLKKKKRKDEENIEHHIRHLQCLAAAMRRTPAS